MTTRLLWVALVGVLSAGCDGEEDPPAGGDTDGGSSSDSGTSGDSTSAVDGSTSGEGPDGDGSTGAATTGGDCLDNEPLPETVDTDLTVGPGCVVMGQTVIRDGAHLEFVEGTTVLVLSDGFLDAGGGFGHRGRMTAVETTFTSAAEEPAPGDWGCIALGTGSSLSSVTIEFAGAECGVNGAGMTTGLYIDGPTPHVTAAILDSAGHGLMMGRFAEITGDEESAYLFNGNALASVNTSPQAVMDVGPSVFEDFDDYILIGPPSTGHIDGVGMLHYQTAPYVVDGHLDIGGGGTPGVSVTIEAGVEIRMSGESIEVHSDATVTALGVPDDPILITSANEDPAPGDWGCMYGAFAEPMSLHNVIFEYAGSGEGCHGSSVEAALAEVPADSEITQSVFRNSAGAGISGQFGVCDPAWCDNTFEANAGVDIACPGSDPASMTC